MGKYLGYQVSGIGYQVLGTVEKLIPNSNAVLR